MQRRWKLGGSKRGLFENVKMMLWGDLEKVLCGKRSMFLMGIKT